MDKVVGCLEYAIYDEMNVRYRDYMEDGLKNIFTYLFLKLKIFLKNLKKSIIYLTKS